MRKRCNHTICRRRRNKYLVIIRTKVDLWEARGKGKTANQEVDHIPLVRSQLPQDAPIPGDSEGKK